MKLELEDTDDRWHAYGMDGIAYGTDGIAFPHPVLTRRRWWSFGVTRGYLSYDRRTQGYPSLDGVRSFNGPRLSTALGVQRHPSYSIFYDQKRIGNAKFLHSIAPVPPSYFGISFSVRSPTRPLVPFLVVPRPLPRRN